jgi:holliday junction DNA helicase RuvA
MIAAIRGTVEGKTLDGALVTVGGGVTLRVLMPLNALARLTVGTEVHLHTHFYVREDAMSLFGFATPEDRDMFEQLLGVGGVGPRIGLAMLSAMSAEGIREAVVSEDVTRLSLTPGVGKKLAGRLVLELRPRFEKLSPFPTAPAAGVPASPAGLRAQAVEALMNLGYPVAHASAAVRSVPEDQAGSLEDLIMRSLRNLASE